MTSPTSLLTTPPTADAHLLPPAAHISPRATQSTPNDAPAPPDTAAAVVAGAVSSVGAGTLLAVGGVHLFRGVTYSIFFCNLSTAVYTRGTVRDCTLLCGASLLVPA